MYPSLSEDLISRRAETKKMATRVETTYPMAVPDRDRRSIILVTLSIRPTAICGREPQLILCGTNREPALALNLRSGWLCLGVRKAGIGPTLTLARRHG